MSRCPKPLAAALCAVLAGGGLSAGERGEKPQEPDSLNAPGRILFIEPWSALDKRSPNGDGLGPMHNATSCVACHHQGGHGGGGDRVHKVELLSIVPVRMRGEDSGKSQFIADVIEIHAGFEIKGRSPDLKPNIVLHRFCTEPDYADFRQRLLGIPTTTSTRAAVLAQSKA